MLQYGDHNSDRPSPDVVSLLVHAAKKSLRWRAWVMGGPGQTNGVSASTGGLVTWGKGGFGGERVGWGALCMLHCCIGGHPFY